MNELAPRPSLQFPSSHGLLSLWDIMHRFYPDLFFDVARQMATLSELAKVPPEDWNQLLDYRDKASETTDSFMGFLKIFRDICRQAKLTHSARLIDDVIDNNSRSQGEVRLVAKSITAELSDRLYLEIPQQRAKHWECRTLFGDECKARFPSATSELTTAGTAYACGLNTASVFHSMRAAEIGLRAVALALSVSFPHGNLELEQWHTIINQIESKIVDLENLKKTTQKSEDQRFYSQAALQFRYFKDGFRVRVAHARESFSETQALSLLNHTCEFFEVLASRLRE